MDWRDEGIILSIRKHGENNAIVSLLTQEHGRHAGMVRGARSAKLRGVLQPGNLVRAEWRARLVEHLGSMTVEAVSARTAPLLTSPGRLAALASACAILDRAVPERAPVPDIFALTDALTERLIGEDWAEAYVKWEVALLSSLGFGLDLSTCAATGVVDDLVYVSPKSARAVSREGGARFKDRLLPLPAFLLPGPNPESAGEGDCWQGLRLTGHFLTQALIGTGPVGITRGEDGSALPDARDRLMTQLEKGDFA